MVFKRWFFDDKGFIRKWPETTLFYVMLASGVLFVIGLLVQGLGIINLKIPIVIDLVFLGGSIYGGLSLEEYRKEQEKNG